MSHLQYQTPFHPGPFASPQQQQGQGQHHQQQQGQSHQQQQQQQQAYTTTHSPNPHQFNTPPGGGASAAPTATASVSASPSVSSTPHQAQAFAPAPSYPGHNLSRPPPPPQFHDGLMQHQPNNYSPAASFAAGQQNPYTTAPFAQSVTATSATPPPQQQQQAIRHSASPQQLNSPYAGPQHHFQQPGQPQLQQQQQQTPKQQTPPTRYPMAAPPLPQTPNAVQQAGATAAGSPQAPQSPGTQAREQKRVEMLLEINMELLQEINNLQAQGRGGAMNPQHQVQLRQLNLPDTMAAEEYIQCLRRVQANLAYLAPRADAQQAAKAPPGPAHMTPPAHMPQLQPKYDQLRELFPGWPGNDMRMAQNAGSPRTNQMNNPMNGMNSQAAQA